jgi:hypothetical protein
MSNGILPTFGVILPNVDFIFISNSHYPIKIGKISGNVKRFVKYILDIKKPPILGGLLT